jgi:hypothetical protein
MNERQSKHLNQIKESISSVDFREIYDCIELRKLIRQEISLKNVKQLNEFAKKLNLSFSVNNKSFNTPTDKGMDIWASTLTECPDSDPNAMRFVYLHPDQYVCNQAKIFEDNDDDFNLGSALQYPKCCIDAYCKWQTDNEDVDPITTITNAFPFDGRLLFYDFPNPFSRYFGQGLYSHFPCSLTCEETKLIAKKSLNNLQTHFPIIANKLIQLENSLVIFQKDEGICIWEKFTRKENKVILNQQSFHGQGKLKETFIAVEEIELTDSSILFLSKDNHKVEFNAKNCFFGAFI